MKESRLRKLVRQEIVNKLDKVTEGEDPFVPTYGKGDVVHDCPKHVQEIKTGKKGKVTGHTLNEAGDVNFVDVDFGTGKIFENIPTKKLKVLEMQEHAHNIKEEPETPVHDTSIVEDLKVKAKKDNEMGSSLGYKLTKSQHSKMLAFLKKNKNNPHVKRLLGTLGDKYSDSVSITLDNRPFFVYGSYGQLRIGHGGKVSRWNSNMEKALKKYIGEAKLYEKVTPSQVSKAFDQVAKVSLELIKNLESYKKAKSSGNEADIKKYTKMAGDLTKKKKAAEANAEKMIQALDKDAKLVMNEAPMDRRFENEWKRNCKVLLTHLQHELRKKPMGQKRAQLQLYAKQITAACEVPSKMSKLVGVQESKLTEGKVRLDEKFGSRKLTALFSAMAKTRWGGGREFLNGMAKQYGIQWDKITDDMVKGPDKKLDRKGIDLIVATKDVRLPASSTYDWTTEIKKGQLLSVTIKGKRVWLGRGIKTGAGRDRNFIGLDKRGYSNVRDVLNIDGAVVYHLDPAKQARGATDVRADREAAKAGATAMIDAKKMKQDNIARYKKALTMKAGEAGRGAIVKMLEKVTKMYHKALEDKLAKMKQGMIPRDSWYADTVKQLGFTYDRIIRSFEEYMRAGANIEAIKKKGGDAAEYSVGYEEKRMASAAREVKVEYNKLLKELDKISKATEFVDVKTVGRAF